MTLADLAPGSRVALLVPGDVVGTPYVALVLALQQAGLVPAPMDPALSTGERRTLLDVVRPDVVVTDVADVPALLTEARSLSRADVPLCRPMHCTSGTTGVPKGVWSGVLTPEAAAALVEEERHLWGFAADDVNLVLSPLHHSAPLRFASGTLLAGGRVVVADKPGGRFDPASVTAALVAHRPTTMFCVPAHLQRLLAHWDESGHPDLSCVRMLAHAGAPCPPVVKHRVLEVFPPGSTWEFYGSTEGQFTACRSEEWLERPGTVGRARAGRSLSVDPDGTIWCAVPPHARFSYFGDPHRTAQAWRETPEGPAFTVGDLGRLDDEGYLYLDGRREDLIISGGVNVYPAEVEGVLAEAEGLRDVAVFALDDDSWGQRVCAAYVGPAAPEQLTAYAREHLAPAKRPKEWHRVDELPRTPTGKVRRLDLPARLDLV